MKNCLFCKNPYTKVKHFRKDYGYCSIECIEASRPPCLNCGAKFVRGFNERPYRTMTRQYCTQHCASVHATAYSRSDETKSKMSVSKSNFYTSAVGREVAMNTGKKFSEWLKTPDGIAHREHITESHREWRKTDAGKQWLEGQLALKKTPEYRERLSQSLQSFFSTEHGHETREHYRNLYSGKPRPPEVTEKMKQSLAIFWDSPEGILLAEQISLKYTDGLPEVSYGPNWTRQRREAQKRDNHTCQLCFTADTTPDTHHIFPRRLFRYVPGENDYFRWANHLDNLVCLCKSCHKKVENNRSLIPEPFLSTAVWHYNRFMSIS